MDELIAARYNIYWYLAFVAPAFVMLLATFWHKRYLLIIGIAVSLLLTYTLCSIAVQEKWNTRYQIAETKEEKEYAMADGANLVFTACFFAPFEAILYTSVWTIVGWKSWPKIRKKRTKNRT